MIAGDSVEVQQCFGGISVSIHHVVAKLSLCMEHIFSIWWTTARQMINVVHPGFEPTLFICQGSALTTRIMHVPDTPVFKDYMSVGTNRIMFGSSEVSGGSPTIIRVMSKTTPP